MKTSLLVLFFFVSSCANHLKDFAQKAQTVSLTVVVTDNARVDLVENHNQGSLIGAVIDTAVAMPAASESLALETRIKDLLISDVVKAMVIKDTVDRLGTRIPFAVSSGQTDGSLEIIVNRYGIEQHSGSPGFIIDYTMSVFSGFTGELVYQKDFFCVDHSFYNIHSPGNIVGTATTIAILREMTNDQLKEGMKAVVERCTQQGLSTMRNRATN